MVDFNDSFRRGLDAAKMAQANRDEIHQVLRQLNRALHSMSEGKAAIVIVPISSTMDSLSRFVFSLDKSKEEQVLAVRSIAQKDAPPKKLALWKQGDAGYPCSIIWGERHASCHDAESLSAELAELVSSPTAGEAILSAMSFQPSE